MSIHEVDELCEILAPYQVQFANHTRSADVIRDSLREAILESQLPSGTWLREEELARLFGVSRTPVREALQVLRTEGLVESAPNQGARVAALTIDDVLAIYLVREVLDGLAARLASVRMTPEHSEQLSNILQQMEDADERRDDQAMSELNLQFHKYLRHVAGNPYLTRFMENVEHAVRRFAQTTFAYPGRGENSIAEHREMCDAIQAGDSERAEQLAIEHVRRARRLRLQMMIEGY